MMKRLKLFWMVVKRTHMDKLVYAFIFNLLAVAAIIMAVEPGINTYGDGLWYTFVACTTIGFGDFAAVTAIGRILTVYMAIHERGCGQNLGLPWAPKGAEKICFHKKKSIRP